MLRTLFRVDRKEYTSSHPIQFPVVEMDEEAFRSFLKKSRKSDSATKHIIELVKDYEGYLSGESLSISEAGINDMENFVLWLEKVVKKNPNRHLWAIGIHYQFLQDAKRSKQVGQIRRKKMKRIPFRIGRFRGVNQDYVKRLRDIGIENVEQMRENGRTPKMRQEISQKTGIPLDSVLEFVKLSDLTRIGAVRSVRARLYHDSGVDTVEKMAQYDPAELRSYLQKWIAETGFDGIAPLPKEAAHAVDAAKRLPSLVEYE